MSALTTTVGGLSVDVPVGTVRWALAIAEQNSHSLASFHFHILLLPFCIIEPILT